MFLFGVLRCGFNIFSDRYGLRGPQGSDVDLIFAMVVKNGRAFSREIEWKGLL